MKSIFTVLFLSVLCLQAYSQKVYSCDSKYDATDNKGLWYFCDSKYDADKKIFFVDSKYDADLIIYFSTSKYDAEWREASKKQLMY